MKKRRELQSDPEPRELLFPTREELEESFARLITAGIPGAEDERRMLIGERVPGQGAHAFLLQAFVRGTLVGPVYERLREVMHEIQIPRRVAMRMRNERG